MLIGPSHICSLHKFKLQATNITNLTMHYLFFSYPVPRNQISFPWVWLGFYFDKSSYTFNLKALSCPLKHWSNKATSPSVFCPYRMPSFHEITEHKNYVNSTGKHSELPFSLLYSHFSIVGKISPDGNYVFPDTRTDLMWWYVLW